MIGRKDLAEVVFMAAALGSGAAAAEFHPLEAARGDFADLRWQARVVVVLADNGENAAYRDQLARLQAARGGLSERDMVVFTDTDPGARGPLGQRLAQGAFSLVLIGKDGGIKRREGAPVTMDSLFATIDAMPMRQREMRQQD